MPNGAPTVRQGEFDQVVVVSGHMIDAPDRPKPRFPSSGEGRVTHAIRSSLRQWHVGPQSLLVCGGARGTDTIAAEQALVLGAAVWLLVALPDDEFIEESVALPDTDWTERYRTLRSRCPTWFQHDVLGPPGEANVFERNNDWCLASALAQAPVGHLRALVVWDGLGGDGPGGTADFVARARKHDASVAIIRPLPG
jgi:hypothetical protein